MIYLNEGEFEKAVTVFEEYLELARKLDDKQSIDKAKVYLGVAKGNLKNHHTHKSS